MDEQKNILGSELKACSEDPMTGFFRDGCCKTDASDMGVHTVCAELTQEFLEYSRDQGNDLMTPKPEFNFPGLKPGDKWCLCASRWLEAYEAGKAPKIIAESTNEKTFHLIKKEIVEEMLA